MEQEYKWKLPHALNTDPLFQTHLIAEVVQQQTSIVMKAVYYDTPV